jgi:protein SCO1
VPGRTCSQRSGYGLRVRRTALTAAAALLLAGCGSSTGAPPATSMQASPFEGAALGKQTPAPEFALTDQAGRTVRLSAQRGRFVLVTFLYTNCPDVCPLIASNLNTALRELGPRRADVRVLAVSVDPRGDTPAAVRAYAKRMHLLPQFLYLTGTSAQLARVWRAYDVLAVARKPDLVDHVAYTVLVDPKGERRVMYGARVRAQQVLHDLRVVMRG